MTKLFRFLLASASCAAVSLSAQMVQPVPGAGDPAATLSAHLRTLAANPRDLFALLGAGQAALDAGDPNAALGFFARADEIAPSNGRAKAGLASALVQLEKPDDALPLFGQAVSLGVPEAEIAADRGLAYDLRGDNRRAQKDYALALKRGANDEVMRRYALSLGISGEQAAAMQMLDPLLRRQDQGAWRARAFILALTGDVAAANTVTRQVMPAPLAASMSPFLTRLARLNPAEKAHAVNFGTMPSDGQTFASVQTGDPFKPVVTPRADISAGAGLIPAGEPLGRKPAGTLVASAAPVPKPIAVPPPPPKPAEATPLGTRVGARIGPVDPARLPPEARGEVTTPVQIVKATELPRPDGIRAQPPAPPAPAPPVQIAAIEPKPGPVSTPVPAPSPPVQITAAAPVVPKPVIAPPALIGPPADPAATPGFSTAPVAPPAAVALPPSTVAETPMEKAAAALPGSRLASIMAGIVPEPESTPVALPTAAEIRAAQKAAAKRAADAAAAAAAKKEADDARAKQVALEKANPARLWVQVATGANARGLAATWKRIREANATALKGLAGYSVPFRSTNRVLAGPVRSAAEARALISALAKNGLSATSYSSEAGQEVVRLAGR